MGRYVPGSHLARALWTPATTYSSPSLPFDAGEYSTSRTGWQDRVCFLPPAQAVLRRLAVTGH